MQLICPNHANRASFSSNRPSYTNNSQNNPTIKSSNLVQNLQNALAHSSFKTKLQKILKAIEFERSRETTNTNDLESLEIFEIFCSGITRTRSLQSLNLSSTNLPDLNMIKLSQSLAKNKSIKTLDFSNNNISSLGFKYLFRMLKENHHLQCLNLFNNEIQKESIEDINSMILKNKNLVDLNLNFCGLDNTSVRALLEALSASKHFKRIHLSKNFFDEKSFHGLGIFLSNIFMNLEQLEIAYDLIDEKSLQIIKRKLKKMPIENMMPTIQDLNFMGNKFANPDAIKYLKYILERISGIQKLNLSKTFLNYLNFKDLSISFKRVHYSLNLSNNIFKDQLPELNNLIHLKMLNLSKTGLTGNSIRNIAKVLKNEGQTHWISLDLSFNHIENEDVFHIFDALRKNKTLQTLDLSHNNFNDKSFENYDRFCGELFLKELNLSDNPFCNSDFIFKLFNNNKANLMKVLILDNIAIEKKLNILASGSYMNKKAHITNLQKIEKISLINSLTLGPVIIRDLSNFFMDLVELNLENSCIFNEERLNDLSEFISKTNKLTTLSLRNLYLGRLSVEEAESFCKGFPQNKSLLNINLSKNKLNKTLEIFLKAISQIKTLINLDLSNNYLSNKNNQILADFLEKTPNLEVYDLSHNPISFVTIDKICKIIVHNNEKLNLKALKLSNISFSLDCLISIGYLLYNSLKIKELDLSNNQIVKINTATLSNRSSKSIDHLILTNCQYDAYQYKLLIKLLIKNPIKVLDLSGSSFMEADITQFIKKTANLKNLMSLDISYIALRDREIGDLLHRMKKLQNLKIIKLNFLDLKENSSKSLFKLLKNNHCVEELDLSDNNLNSIFIKCLKESLIENDHLKILLLRKTRLTDELLLNFSEVFEKNVTLKQLDLRMNLFSIISLEKLVQTLNFKTESKQGLESLLLSENKLDCIKISDEFSLLKFSQALKHNKNLSTLELENTFPMKPSEVRSLSESLKITANLKRLNLNNNNLGQEEVVFLSKLILTCQSLQFLSISKNKFGFKGIKILLENLDKNLTLKELDISNTIFLEEEGNELCIFLDEILNNNYNSLEIINISENCVGEIGNKVICNTLKTNKNIYFINNHWQKIRNELAHQVLESLVRHYKKQEENIEVNELLKHLNFSNGKLDDDFCIYFSHHIQEYTYLESLNISENKKITLIGLKFIYVYLKYNIRLKKIYFKEYSHDSALNNGIAISIIHWSKYTHYDYRILKIFQKIAYAIFFKMQIIANRFQYNESFDKFFASINDYWIFLLFFVNFILQFFLALFLPIYYVSDKCGGGQDWNSHIIYGVYLGITLCFEFCFLVASRKKIISNLYEKDLKREVIVNDALNLVGGVFLRFDTYTDVCFLTIAYQCNTDKIFWASLIVVIVKVIVKSVQNLRTLHKLLKRIRKKQKMDCLNLYAKLCCFQAMPLSNDILDRYCPGNAKRIHHVLCKKLNHSIYLNVFILDSLLKFALEDIPQTILQSLFLFYKNPAQLQNSNNWIIWFSVLKNCCSLIGSFYTMVSLRPSYIEQSDFDEFLTVQQVFQGKKDDAGFGLSLLKRFNTFADKKMKSSSTMNFVKTSLDGKSSYNGGSIKFTSVGNLKKFDVEEPKSEIILDLSEDVSFDRGEKMHYFEPEKQMRGGFPSEKKEGK